MLVDGRRQIIRNPQSAIRNIKCVVWDLDETLWSGVQAEGAPPQPRPAVLAVIDTLAARGIVHSVASRNDPAAGARLLCAGAIGWEGGRMNAGVRHG